MSPNATLYDLSHQGLPWITPFDVKHMQLDRFESILGGELEVLQLDGRYCLLINSQAREQLLPKNKAASQLWFDCHPESGAGADFIQGPVIHCAYADVAHLQHLRPAAQQVLTPLQREERAQLLASAARQQQNHEEARLLCSRDNPGSCEMCGS